MAFESRCGARLASSEGNSPAMKKACRKKSVSDLASATFAQVSGQSPWENAVSVLQQAFTSTIARGCPWLRLSWPGSPSPSVKVARSVCLPACCREKHMVATTNQQSARSLSLTILGPERELFFFAMCLGAATKNGHRFLTDTQAPAKVRFSTTDSPVPAKPRRRSLPAPSKGRREDRGAGRQKSPRRSRLSGEAPLP